MTTNKPAAPGPMEPIKGKGFDPNTGGFSALLVGTRLFSAEQVRAALSQPVPSAPIDWLEAADLHLEGPQTDPLMDALIRCRDGYLSERATGLPVLEKWRDETLAAIDAALSSAPASAPEPSEYLWRVFNLGFPKGHEDGSGRWGDWNLISREDAQRLAADDEHKSYEFVPYLPAPLVPAAAPAVEPTEAIAQLRHLVDDIVVKAPNGDDRWLIRAGAGLLFSNFVGAVRRLLASLPASPEPAIAPALVNQCDGCRRGLPMKGDIHFNPNARYDLIACTADQYASPEPATKGAAKPVHTDHPFQHWDRTCPACVLEASPPAPEPLTPAAGVSESPICPHCSKPAFAWPESAIRRGRHVVGGVVVYHCREAAIDD